VANGQAGSGSATAPADLRSGALARYLRVIITALLLLVVMAGVRVAAPAVAGRGLLRHDALALGIAAEATLAALEIAFFVRARRYPHASRQAVLIRKGLQFVSAMIMAVIVAIALVNAVFAKHPGRVLKAITGSSRPPKHPKIAKLPHFAPVNLGYLVYIAMALLILAAIAVCVWLVLHRRRGLARTWLDEAVTEDAEQLRQAVESGRAALRVVDDARAAIIACYVAMEGSLEQAGTARGLAETPDELLGRATASGLLRGPAARQLTVLFYEARFSTHDLPDGAKDNARQALDAISAELASKAAGDPAGTARPPGLAAEGASR
jgi:hypothetical protein